MPDSFKRLMRLRNPNSSLLMVYLKRPDLHIWSGLNKVSITWESSNSFTSLPYTVLLWLPFGNNLYLHLWGLLVTLHMAWVNPLGYKGTRIQGAHTQTSVDPHSNGVIGQRSWHLV